jgi:chromosome segregation ATPase
MKAEYDAETSALKATSEAMAATMASKESIANNVIQTLKTRIDQLSKENKSLDEQLANEVERSSSLRLSMEELNSSLTKHRTDAESETDRYESMMSALQVEKTRLEAELEAKIVAHEEELAGLGDSHKKTMAKHLDDHSEKVGQYESELSALRAARESLEADMQATIAAHEAETARIHDSHKETIEKHIGDHQETLEEHTLRLQREHADLVANMKAEYDAEVVTLRRTLDQPISYTHPGNYNHGRFGIKGRWSCCGGRGQEAQGCLVSAGFEVKKGIYTT